MPVAAPPGFTLGALKPEDAISIFEQRGLLRPSFRWQDVWSEEHTRAFAVAGVMRLDVLAEIRKAVDQAVSTGQNFWDFREQLRGQLVKMRFWGNVEVTDPSTGEVRRTKFDDRRLHLIFDVNMRQSYAAGRWQRIQRGKMPFIVYRTMQDEHVRVSHRPWNNVVLPKDHPWWDTHFPPCGWRCRCIAFATDERGLDQLRAAAPKDSPVKTEPPDTQWVEFFNKVTGQTQRVPRGIDPGFAYNPGKVAVQRSLEFMERRLADLQPVPAGAGNALELTKAVIARGRREKAFAEFLDRPPQRGAADTGLPVAAVPSMAGEPPVASVAASMVRQAQQAAEYPRRVPLTVAGWAMAQAVLDQGQRLELAGGTVLWWWARGSGQDRRVHVLELQRAALVWWVQRLAALSEQEARREYPPLGPLLG